MIEIKSDSFFYFLTFQSNEFIDICFKLRRNRIRFIKNKMMIEKMMRIE